jgi:hypothetical protein
MIPPGMFDAFAGELKTEFFNFDNNRKEKDPADRCRIINKKIGREELSHDDKLAHKSMFA